MSETTDKNAEKAGRKPMSLKGKVSQGTVRQSFKITGRDKCEERGYAKAGFFEVDTQDAADYTHRLTE